jgi:hypothetical protein
MNRSMLERELKLAGISLNGWMPVLQCDACKRRWEPFQVAVGESAPTVRLDYWKCPGGCNQSVITSHALRTALPKYVVLNDIPGMIFGDEDLPEFERFVRSMDMTELANQENKG